MLWSNCFAPSKHIPSLDFVLLFSISIHPFRDECVKQCVCVCVCTQWKVLIFAWNWYLATQTNKWKKNSRSPWWIFVNTLQIWYHKFLCIFSMFMLLFVCYVFISLFIIIFCGCLMHVFQCFNRKYSYNIDATKLSSQ